MRMSWNKGKEENGNGDDYGREDEAVLPVSRRGNLRTQGLKICKKHLLIII